MINRLKNISNSYVCEISMLSIVCCMVITTSQLLEYNHWNEISSISSLLGGIILISLLIWATFKLVTHREVKEMPVRSRLLVELCSRILMLYWIYISCGYIVAILWAGFIVWDGIRSFRCIHSDI